MTEQQLSQYEAVNSSAESAEPWRNEVQDRLAHYKRRRGGRRIEGAYTMRFPFPAYEPEETTASAEPLPMDVASPVVFDEAEPESIAASIDLSGGRDPQPGDVAVEDIEEEIASSPIPELGAAPTNIVLPRPTIALEDDDAPFVDPVVVRPRPKRKVIAFPKHLSVAPEPMQRLADPVATDVPRILDVPEELEAIPTTPYLDGLQLDVPDPTAEAVRREHVELPYEPVATSRRVFAGAVDLGVIAASTMIFGAVAYKILDYPTPSKYLVLGLLAGAVTLWIAYQYLFVVYAGKTLGMVAARIRLRTFAGKAPSMRLRRNRVLGLYMSSMALGMGLMWSFVDVDRLCWHDRLSATYPANRE